MTPLPAAYVRDPACGACMEDLEADGDGGMVCHRCLLSYRDLDAPPAFSDGSLPPCGAPDESEPLGSWVSRGVAYSDAGPGDPCPLPLGHASGHLWQREIETGAV